ncbi:hypothetical protein DFH94DRAFT_54389 [Russula ochroleuca]|uniref:Uncharacterized protein n=1 Tax=Russula ochroleuca TaxID=152965 RepID=A0A9P5MTD5_9AGAM|nr:hypothetical protein DFH94DRAFT_54389 [Russula ochroleuca]
MPDDVKCEVLDNVNPDLSDSEFIEQDDGLDAQTPGAHTSGHPTQRRRGCSVTSTRRGLVWAGRRYRHRVDRLLLRTVCVVIISVCYPIQIQWCGSWGRGRNRAVYIQYTVRNQSAGRRKPKLQP